MIFFPIGDFLFAIPQSGFEALEFSLLQKLECKTGDIPAWRSLSEDSRQKVVMDAVFGSIDVERAGRVFLDAVNSAKKINGR